MFSAIFADSCDSEFLRVHTESGFPLDKSGCTLYILKRKILNLSAHLAHQMAVRGIGPVKPVAGAGHADSPDESCLSQLAEITVYGAQAYPGQMLPDFPIDLICGRMTRRMENTLENTLPLFGILHGRFLIIELIIGIITVYASILSLNFGKVKVFKKISLGFCTSSIAVSDIRAAALRGRTSGRPPHREMPDKLTGNRCAAEENRGKMIRFLCRETEIGQHKRKVKSTQDLAGVLYGARPLRICRGERYNESCPIRPKGRDTSCAMILLLRVFSRRSLLIKTTSWDSSDCTFDCVLNPEFKAGFVMVLTARMPYPFRQVGYF